MPELELSAAAEARVLSVPVRGDGFDAPVWYELARDNVVDMVTGEMAEPLNAMLVL